ncbi:MAG: hypothetical protein K0R03_817 [Moraxellaceae bacterium]|jgi:hypothetical protein|nr:hypothetical protein [Moraxellaceae bacterium]
MTQAGSRKPAPERRQQGREELEQAFDVLEEEVPGRVARAIRWLRSPRSRKVRLPLGIFLIVCSFFAFLPVLGLELLPLGLMLVAQDVPFLRRPVARGMLWLERKWEAHQRRRS